MVSQIVDPGGRLAAAGGVPQLGGQACQQHLA
jgi:hypothetical protein